MVALLDPGNPDKTSFGDFRNDGDYFELDLVPSHAELIGSLHFNQRVNFRLKRWNCIVTAVVFGGRRLTAECDFWEVTGHAQDPADRTKPWRRFIARFEVEDDGYGRFQYLE